jgi:hypothetical protein
MTTPIESSTKTHPTLTGIGSVLVGAPLVAGAGASLMALAGRFGGPGSAFTASWYVAAALAPAALVGAALLLLATRHRPASRAVAIWAALSAGGWVFGLGSAQVSGLAQAEPAEGVIWPYLLLGGGVGVYMVGLVGLLVVARRHSVARPHP